MCATSSLRKQTVVSCPNIGIILYVAQAVERVSAVTLGTNYSYNRQTSRPRWDSHAQSQQAWGRKTSLGVYIYIFIGLKTFSEGNF